MAIFVSRIMAHTNARPAGITMQVEDTSVTAGDTVDLVVSLRDENHDPVVDASIDLFYVAEGEEGFASSGRCSGKASHREAGNNRCVYRPRMMKSPTATATCSTPWRFPRA